MLNKQARKHCSGIPLPHWPGLSSQPGFSKALSTLVSFTALPVTFCELEILPVLKKKYLTVSVLVYFEIEEVGFALMCVCVIYFIWN